MAQQQHRQACLAHWPGHHSKSTEARRRRRNSRECSQRSKVENQGGDMTAQPRLWQQGHRPEAAPAKGATSCSRPSGQAQHGGGIGVAAAVQPTRRREEHRKHRSEGRSSSKARQSRSSRVGKIYWGGAPRRWRRLEAEGTKPHGQEEARDAVKQRRHRAAADLAEARRSRARSSSVTQSPEGN
jgi:hypothetical protein